MTPDTLARLTAARATAALAAVVAAERKAERARKEAARATAAAIREKFIEHEDFRDAWGPARVLHASVELAGIAKTGPVPPFQTDLDDAQKAQLAPAAIRLRG